MPPVSSSSRSSPPTASGSFFQRVRRPSWAFSLQSRPLPVSSVSHPEALSAQDLTPAHRGRRSPARMTTLPAWSKCQGRAPGGPTPPAEASSAPALPPSVPGAGGRRPRPARWEIPPRGPPGGPRPGPQGRIPAPSARSASPDRSKQGDGGSRPPPPPETPSQTASRPG